MRLFIFKSESNDTLRAFADDLIGSRLPAQFKPWTAIGAVAADGAMPYTFERGAIEQAITDQGFQLWRFKAVAKPADKQQARQKAQPAAS